MNSKTKLSKQAKESLMKIGLPDDSETVVSALLWMKKSYHIEMSIEENVDIYLKSWETSIGFTHNGESIMGDSCSLDRSVNREVNGYLCEIGEDIHKKRYWAENIVRYEE